ncbi:MAG: hypothetical protein A3H98_10530 [Bacteroidetes bacterium RIFCSPLOWO2_02_FULL_36_8]|nr:MAG: hypothetical protein A3H98_10530 [Bacteroidetes bacterium RIFCSPLOWO2_02_FULL_36_8]
MGASFETGNMGVSALAASLIKNIKQNKSDANIAFLIGNKIPKTYEFQILDQTIPIKVINYRLSPKSKIHEHLLWIFLLAFLQSIIPFKSIKERIIQSNLWLRTLKESNFVGNIHGGDSFSDIYGFLRFIIEAIPDLIVLLMNKKLVLLPQTYGPYKHIIAQYIAKFIIRRSRMVCSRDSEGIEMAIKLRGIDSNGNVENVKFCPDIAFTLDSVKLEEPIIVPPISQSMDMPLIGFNISGLMYSGGYTGDNMFGLKLDYKSFTHKLVANILKRTEAHILLVPHTFGIKGNINSDPDACSNVLSLLKDSYKERVHFVMREYNQSEIKGVVGICDFFIGSRMHACIAALSQGIPTVGVAYSKKFSGVFASVGMEDMVIDCRFLDAEAAVEKIIQFYNNRDEIKTNLEEKVDNTKLKIRKTFGEILST